MAVVYFYLAEGPADRRIFFFIFEQAWEDFKPLFLEKK
jgi:hypothetical protein